METYESLLSKAYKEVKIVVGKNERFEVPKVEGEVSGKNTIITNMGAIAGYIRRPIEQLSKYLQKELAVSGKVDKDKLVLNTKLSSSRVNEKIEQYVKEFVLCKECGKPDTEMIAEKGVKFKHCLACGAKNPIKTKI